MSAEAYQLDPVDSIRVVYGDWQTPDELAAKISSVVHKIIEPQLIIEPNCGLGAFLYAAANEFPACSCIWGADINECYVDRVDGDRRIEVHQADFFKGLWKTRIRNSKGPILVLGNPPWVTNSELMRRESGNLPAKRNLDKLTGIDAITGKSNFDISQWMIQEEIQALQRCDAVLAMLCKSTVARKAILYAWRNKLEFTKAEIRAIDAKRYFDVSVDACLLFIHFCPTTDSPDAKCEVYSDLESALPSQSLGLRNGSLVNDTGFIDSRPDLLNSVPSSFCWRSGIKHDCAKIMELNRLKGDLYTNGLSETVELETSCLYPLLKSSDLANGRLERISRYMLVPQTRVGQDTGFIRDEYPKTWNYLQSHREWFEKRKSSIYRGKPAFSVFGIGDYTFTSWKVAISGLYKKLAFQLVAPFDDKLVVFDDTCYFLPCQTEAQARFARDILNSELCRQLLNAIVFWDAKRPITRDVLNRVNLFGLADALNQKDEYERLFRDSGRFEQLALL